MWLVACFRIKLFQSQQQLLLPPLAPWHSAIPEREKRRAKMATRGCKLINLITFWLLYLGMYTRSKNRESEATWAGRKSIFYRERCTINLFAFCVHQSPWLRNACERVCIWIWTTAVTNMGIYGAFEGPWTVNIGYPRFGTGHYSDVIELDDRNVDFFGCGQQNWPKMSGATDWLKASKLIAPTNNS